MLRDSRHAQVSLVRSITNGRLFANVLPKSQSPRLVERIKHNDGSDALYFEFCNGGDLCNLIGCYSARSERIPEQFIWHIFAQMTTSVVYLRYGLTESSKLPKDWNAIYHRDIYIGNFLLHWPEASVKQSRFPDVLICDWGRSRYHSQGLDEEESPEGDFFNVFRVLFCLCLLHHRPHDSSEVIMDTVETLPYSTDLKQLLVDLERFAFYSEPLTKFSFESATRLISLAEKKLKEFEDKANSDLDYEWTKPADHGQPILFCNKKDCKVGQGAEPR